MKPFKFLSPILAVVALSAVLGISSCSSDSKEIRSKVSVENNQPATNPSTQANVQPANYEIIRHAPGFSIPDLSGRTVNWDQYSGKLVLVDFWATWCGPCRRSIPHLSDLQKKYASKGFEVVGISLDRGNKNGVQQFAQDMKIPYTVLLGNMDLASEWGVGPGIPMAFLVDRKGNIVDKFIGYQEREAYEQKIEKFL